MNLPGATLKHNNLGGAGPDNGAENMVFQSVGKYEGKALDLVITTPSSYSIPDDGGPNGKMSNWGGKIKMKAGQDLNLTFTFVETDTTTEVKVSEALLSIFDVDGNPTVSGDEVIFSTYAGYVTDAEPIYSIRVHPDGSTVFAAKLDKSNSGSTEDPESPMELTEKQRKSAVMLIMKDTASVSFQWRLVPLENGQTSYKWLYFSGASSLIDRCAD